MSIRKVSFVEGEYYHIYNRGNDKRLIFHNKQDYNYFISLLFIANSIESFNIIRLMRKKDFSLFDVDVSQKLVSIGAYVLMPNHFHILVTQIEEDGVSKFMQKICTAYAMYYNKKYERSGSLFEGKFKSQYLENDRYLKYIFSYIHLNPVKLIDSKWKENGIKNIKETLRFLNNYYYSSFKDFMEGFSRKESVILNIKSFPYYFSNKKNFYSEILEWLNYNK